MEEKFKAVAKAIEDTKGVGFSNEQKLDLYKYFKQSTIGDNTTDKPGVFNMKGKAKWNAWNDVKGMKKEEAMAKYIETAKKVLPKEISDKF